MQFHKKNKEFASSEFETRWSRPSATFHSPYLHIYLLTHSMVQDIL